MQVESVLQQHYGVRVPLSLIVDEAQTGSAAGAPAAPATAADEEIDINDTTLSSEGGVDSPAQRLQKAFPGAEEMS